MVQSAVLSSLLKGSQWSFVLFVRSLATELGCMKSILANDVTDYCECPSLELLGQSFFSKPCVYSGSYLRLQ